MNGSFLIEGLGGKKSLSGEIAISGAKNDILPALASSLLFYGPIRYGNIPDILDVSRMCELLSGLGAGVNRTKGSVTIDADTFTKSGKINGDIAGHLRASIVLSGPALARFKKITFPHPGGCVIGQRPIDFFLDGFKEMGAKVIHRNNKYHVSCKAGLRGAHLFFKWPSVTATSTFMMAGVLARGTTVINNAAMEPEIENLAQFLNKCGAKIIGAGTPTIEIRGTNLLRARTTYKTIPDRIEAGSFLILGALAAKNLTLKYCEPTHLQSLIERLQTAGVPIEIDKQEIRIVKNTKSNHAFKAVEIRTHEFPGFPTDLQSPMSVFLTQVAGESLVFETIFEGRLNFTEDLNRMGADISMWNPHKVLIKGPTPLKGRELEGPDLRAELAFVIAGIVAKGTSTIHNLRYVDRGYEKLEEKLAGIGVDITRFEA